MIGRPPEAVVLGMNPQATNYVSEIRRNLQCPLEPFPLSLRNILIRTHNRLLCSSGELRPDRGRRFQPYHGSRNLQTFGEDCLDRIFARSTQEPADAVEAGREGKFWGHERRSNASPEKNAQATAGSR